MVIQTKWVLVAALLLSSGVFAQSSEDSANIGDDRLHGQVESINENLAVVNSDLSILKWLKVSGYLQARYELNDTSQNGVLNGDYSKNRNANNFYIRRGRLKFTFQPLTSSRYVFYIDASKQSISLKEAYVELNKRFGEHGFALTAGQFNIPFGYEIEYSSSKRDFPERSLAENKLFKGERDRGLNFTYVMPRYLQFNIALLQGWGIEGSEGKSPTWYDPTIAKDFVARAKAKLGMVDLGISGYWGKNYLAGSPSVAARAGVTTWFDANGNSIIDAGETTTTAPVAAKSAVAGFEKDKTRYGADAQVYLDILPFGGTAFRGELFIAEDYNNSAADSLASKIGWYLWLSQSLSTKFGAAVRYDYWDPNTDATAANDAIGTLSLAGHYYFDSYVRITAAYDIPSLLEGRSTFRKHPADITDNRFTLQFQFAI
ncbi:MAG: porin [candidate division Zixibacteria bacterium]|nr:porin [candidate division Zixibacteria bacterium]